MKIFITGTAGFIGFHVAKRLLAEGHEIAGFDGMTPYYDVLLKQRRHAMLRSSNGFGATEAMLEDREALEQAISDFAPEIIVHLAAQAGVRYSYENPQSYVSSNLAGTFHVLEAARKAKPRHLVFASTSSVYGGNQRMPFAEVDRTDFPLSLYAATKKSCEAMSHSYAHLHGMPTTCLRFFTVYGPWGRPDMALFKFAMAMQRNEPIDIYGHGRMSRDFTYIDDLVEGITRLLDAVPDPGNPVVMPGIMDSLSPVAPWRAVNVAGGRPVEITTYIEALERAMGVPSVRRLLPDQPGDVSATLADPRLLEALTGYRPATPVERGVQAFVDWYRVEYACK